jgi:drug/metabolite transporter (DMT)-like permease
MTTVSHDSDAVGGGASPRPAPSAATTGLVLALVSATAFGLSGPLARGLMDAGWSAGAAVTARVGVAALVLLPAAARELRGRWSLLRENLGVILVFGLVPVAGTQLAFFSAIEHLPVGIALLVEYTAPVTVVGWLWLRYGQRPGRLTVVGGILAALGLLLVLDLTGGSSVSLLGLGWAVLAMLGVTTYFVISALHGNGLPPLTLSAGGLLVGTAALGLGGLTGLLPLEATASSVVYVPAEVPWWVAVGALGVVTAALSYSTGVAANRRLGSRLASFVALSEVLAAVLWAWALVGELPRPVQLLGGVLVLAGVVVVKLGEAPDPL